MFSVKNKTNKQKTPKPNYADNFKCNKRGQYIFKSMTIIAMEKSSFGTRDSTLALLCALVVRGCVDFQFTFPSQ